MSAKYIVMDAGACMPAKCWGRYRRVGVVEVEPGAKPKMLSERAIGVVAVVQTWERLNHGTTDRCAYRVALAEAEALAAALNAGVS